MPETDLPLNAKLKPDPSSCLLAKAISRSFIHLEGCGQSQLVRRNATSKKILASGYSSLMRRASFGVKKPGKWRLQSSAQRHCEDLEMSRVLSTRERKQCGFLQAWHEYDCGSAEWWVDCPRCGYHESWEHKSRFSDGHLEKAVNEVTYSAGALWAKDAKSGIAQLRGLAENEVEEIAAKMRVAIASGELSPKSYLTKFNFETREMTALVGEAPSGHATPQPAPASAREFDFA